LFAGFALLYEWTRARVFSYDGLCYALDVEFGPPSNLYHPNHLFYSVFSRGAFRLFQALGYHGRAIFLMQALNAFVAAGAVTIFFLIIRRRFGAVRAMLAAAFLGLGNAFWTQAVDPGCYAWASLGACLTLALLLESRKWRAFRLGISHGALMLLHQMFSLTLPSFVLKLWREESSFQRRLRRVGGYGLGVLAGAGGPYLAVAASFHRESFQKALFWALGPAGPPPGVKILSSYWWNLNLKQDLPLAWTSFVQCLVDGGSGRIFFSLGAALFLAALALWSARAWKAARKEAPLRGEIAALWLWIIALNLLQMVFWVGSVHYRILFLPPLFYLGAAASRPLRSRGAAWTAALLAGVMAALNFTQAIRPRMSWDANAARTVWVSRTVGAKDFFLFAGQGPASIMNVYFAYFAPQVPARSLSGYFSYQRDASELLALLDSARQKGGRLFIEESLRDEETQKRLEASAGLPAGTLRVFMARFKAREVFHGPFRYGMERVDLER